MSPKGAHWGVVDPDLKVKGVEGLDRRWECFGELVTEYCSGGEHLFDAV
jgi:hypothetical protein